MSAFVCCHNYIIRPIPAHVYIANVNKQDRNTVTYQTIFSKTNINTFFNEVKNTSWNEILNESNYPEKACNQFLKMYLDLYETNFPIKQRINKNIQTKTKVPGLQIVFQNLLEKRIDYIKLISSIKLIKINTYIKNIKTNIML